MQDVDSNFSLSFRGEETYIGILAYFVVAMLFLVLAPMISAFALMFVLIASAAFDGSEALMPLANIFLIASSLVASFLWVFVLLTASVRRLRSSQKVFITIFLEILPLWLIGVLATFFVLT